MEELNGPNEIDFLEKPIGGFQNQGSLLERVPMTRIMTFSKSEGEAVWQQETSGQPCITPTPCKPRSYFTSYGLQSIVP